MEFKKEQHDTSKSEGSVKVLAVTKSEGQLVKPAKAQGKQEPITNNYYVLFSDQEKIINGQMAATKHKFNKFTILNNNKLWSFKFDHIIKPRLSYLASSGEAEEVSEYDQYVNLEVDRFLAQDRNLIYVNMTEDCKEKLPTIIPEFPRQFYTK